MAAFVAKSGVGCTPANIRAIGASPNNSFFELACQEQNGGYILQTSTPPRLDKPITANPCLAVPETSNLKCILTPREAQLAVVDKLAGQHRQALRGEGPPVHRRHPERREPL